MKEKPQSLESQLQMARPKRAEIKRVPLTPEEKEFLGKIMDKAVAAEKAGRLAEAISHYTDYKNEFLKIKEAKERKTEIEKNFELKKQYEDQVETLKKNGLIEALPSGEMGFIDITGTPRPIPTYEEILERVKAKKEFLERKREQGFSQLLLVPFGMRIADIKNRIKKLILEKYEQGKLNGTNGDSLELNTTLPIRIEKDFKSADLTGDLVYYPKKFDPENHGGKTKLDILADEGGWDILFLEDMPDLPFKGREKAGRTQFSPGMEPYVYLYDLQNEEQYKGEQGMTPEAELTYFMYYLQKNNKVIDDYQGSGKVNWNLGGFFKNNGTICCSGWDREHKIIFVGSIGRHSRNVDYNKYSARTAVRV